MQWKLTPEVSNSITAFILAGAFPHVAAQAAGVPTEVFERWLEVGSPVGRKKGWRPHPTYTPFWRAVTQARAQARLNAEMEAMRRDPLRWLMQGPGKERPNDPGWSQVVRPVLNQDNRSVNILLAPEMQSIFASILQVLAPYPEARAAVAQALAGNSPRVIVARPKEETQTGR